MEKVLTIQYILLLLSLKASGSLRGIFLSLLVTIKCRPACKFLKKALQGSYHYLVYSSLSLGNILATSSCFQNSDGFEYLFEKKGRRRLFCAVSLKKPFKKQFLKMNLLFLCELCSDFISFY